MAEMRNRDLRTDYDGGSGKLPDNLPPVGGVSRAQSEWNAGRDALEFTITESLESYQEARAAKEYNAAVTFLEQCAVAALRLSDYTTQRVVADAEKHDLAHPIDFDLVVAVLDAVDRIIPPPAPQPIAVIPTELEERAAALVETTSTPSTEWWKNHKDYTE
jgi:hypothetical protein